MEIGFVSTKMFKTFSLDKLLVREYGKKKADKLKKLMSLLQAVETLKQIPENQPYRRHQLKGDRKGQFAINVDTNYRLILKPSHEPMPLLEDGGVDIQNVTAITILSVEDYH